MGSFSILNNPAAIAGQNQLNLNNISLNRTLNRMASGMRINTGADDAAGLQIADSLRANVYALNQGIRNANDGISYLHIVDGALAEITNLLTRTTTLASAAATETNDLNGRIALNNEFQIIQEEIARIARDTNFNGSQMFDRERTFGELLELFVGDLSYASYIDVKVGYVDVWEPPADMNTALSNSKNNTNDGSKLSNWLTTNLGASMPFVSGSVGEKVAIEAAIAADKAYGIDTTFAGIANVSSWVVARELEISAAVGSTNDNVIKNAAEAKAKLDLFCSVIGMDKVAGFGLPHYPGNPAASINSASHSSLAKLSTVHLLTRDGAEAAFNYIRESLNSISMMRGDIGAGMNRLQAAVAVMQTQSRHTLSAESSIRDANMAEEITNLTKFQILAQTGIAALAHANNNSQIVLNLLQ